MMTPESLIENTRYGYTSRAPRARGVNSLRPTVGLTRLFERARRARLTAVGFVTCGVVEQSEGADEAGARLVHYIGCPFCIAGSRSSKKTRDTMA